MKQNKKNLIILFIKKIVRSQQIFQKVIHL
jgi:hypothetical protein